MHTMTATHSSFERILSNVDWPGRGRLRSEFRLDRRTSPRWRIPGNATILSLGHELGLVVELHGLDGSPWWLAGDSITPVAENMRVSVGFSDPNGRPATGIVMRCDNFGEGRFRIAIRFDGAHFL